MTLFIEMNEKIVDEMRELEEYFNSMQRNGTMKMVDLYEQVQNCGNVVPRLYLMCCVGGVYISSLEAPAKDILKDMLEMSKGVQHNMRGLFLRCYLTQISRNKLPDMGTVFEGAGGTVQDAYNFLITNFCETNRLWVRLQTQGASKDRKKREKERQDLRILVGTNLVRLSQLDGLDVNEYKVNVLPKILEEIVSCKDTIAQGYLMDCIIQVFPDDFHMATLEAFLGACKELREKVPVRSILESMMDRLASHAASAGGASGQVLATLMEINAFKLFNDCVTELIMNRSNMTLPETLRLQMALTNFALKCYPGRMDYVTHTLNTASALLEKAEFKAEDTTTEGEDKSSDETTVQIEELLSSPLSSLSLRVMELPAFAKLMTYLPWGNWKEVASTLLRSAIAANTPLTEVEHIEQLFSMIMPLLRDKELPTPVTRHEDDDDDETPAPTSVTLQFKDEQMLVARVVHLMKSDNTDTQIKIYNAAKAHFINGGTTRIQFTLAPLVFGALSLAKRVHAREKAFEAGEGEKPELSTRKVFHFIIEIVTAMASSLPDISLRLFLNAAQAADEFSYSAIAYEFLKEALLIYESDISESKAQVRSLTIIVGTLLSCTNFSTEDYEALITKVAQYSNKLLKKPDQCRMITLCSHLFWPRGADTVAAVEGTEGSYSDCDRLLECMQRALKIASVCNPNLFVEILDHYIYYYENDNPIIQVRYLSGLIALINEQLGSEANASPSAATEAHYRNTLEYIKNRQIAAETAERFSKIQLTA